MKSNSNREVFPPGTRVIFVHNKLEKTYGTVDSITDDGERMFVIWDGNEFPTDAYKPLDLKEAE